MSSNDLRRPNSDAAFQSGFGSYEVVSVSLRLDRQLDRRDDDRSESYATPVALGPASGGMLIRGMGARRSPPGGGDLLDAAVISW
jgi:hypothetical protein